ncbi:MAG: acetylglutamate kinase [bacterium]|nr:acetylglutamate kinase [bacterium]
MQYNYATPPGPLVVKYGGNALPADGSPDPLLAEVAALHRAGERVVLVHGGGPEIDRRLAELAIPTRRIDGLRVTDLATLEVTEAALCGTINKRLVRACAALGVAAVGISGEDARTLVARRALGGDGQDLGYVGEVTYADPHLVLALLDAGFLPIVAPLAIADDAAHAYNVNADLAAAALAGALRARAFVIVTNVPRVLADRNDPSSGIEHLTVDAARAFAASDACASGMQPKMNAAIAAVAAGCTAAYICAANETTIRSALTEGNATHVSP